MSTYDSPAYGAALTRDQSRAVFGQVMGLVAVTVGFAALGAWFRTRLWSRLWSRLGTLGARFDTRLKPPRLKSTRRAEGTVTRRWQRRRRRWRRRPCRQLVGERRKFLRPVALKILERRLPEKIREKIFRNARLTQRQRGRRRPEDRLAAAATFAAQIINYRHMSSRRPE